ncbi:MAG: hypothetical protein HYR84_07110, partial [Planctomycetes bacterium]|nr:hypothetical protein [Planctomycetota bacterium]
LPTFFVGIVGVGWCVAQILRAREASPQGTTLTIHPPTGASFLGCAIGLLFLGLTWNGAAQTPPPRAFTVFVLDGAKPSVLGPPELIRRLDEMEQQAITDGPGAVLLSAKYVGKVKDTQALFDVVYELHSFGDKANVFVPLSGPPGNPQAGLQLIDAFLDGAPAFPAPHKTGFLFPIRGKGAHTLRVSFSVRVAADGDQLKLHYSIPKLIQNEVKLQGLSPTRKLVSLHGFGEEKWLADGAKPATPWHAQLGYEGIVHLRWANPKASPGPKTVEVKENHFWDLHPSSPALTSVLRYLVGNDSRASFAVSAPDGLHVRGVEVFKASSPGAPSTRVVVRSWNVIGDTDQRRLVIELAQPAGGEVTIQIEAVPFAGVKAGKVVLAPPAPLQGKSSGGSLAYRLNAKEVAIFAKNLNVQSSKTDEFEILGKKPAVLVTRAYRFERSAVKAALELVTQPNTWRAQGQLQWIVDAHHADLAGKVTITSLHADVAFLEFFADPALTIAQVAGADVARWQRQDSRLQIWLKQPRKETTLAIAGWRSTSMKSRPPEEQKIALPAIYPLNTAPGGLTLDVRAAAGLQLKVGALKRLRTAAPGALQFIVDEAPYEASFHVSPDTQPPDAFLLTKVQASERGFDYWHGIRLISKRGYLPDVVLRVADCPHGALLDAPGGTPKQVTAKTAKDQTWIVTYPRDLPQDVTLTVRASIAAHQGRKLTLPIVAIESVTLRNHGLAWTGVDIETGEPPEKLGHQKAAKDRLASSVREDWYTEVALWNHASAPRAAVAVLPPASLPTTTRVLASSEAIWPTTEGHWMHEAAYWIAATEETDLRVKFPRPVGSLGVWIDGGFLPAATPGRAEVTLRLTASREPRRIELRWRYAQDVEQSESPEVGAVKLEQAILPDHSRVLWMPPGTTAPSSSSSPTVVSRFLSEARAHMQISAALAQESRSEHAKKIATRQLQFRACIRQADYALACLKTIRPDLDLTTWQAHVRALDRQNAELAKEHRFEAQRQAALKAKVHALVPAFFDERITPGVPLVLSPTLPELALSTADAAQLAGQWTASYLLLLVGVFLLIASYFRHGWSVFQHAAPELAVALIGGVWALFGIGLIGAILLGMFALYRLWWLTVVLRDWFVGAAPTPDKAKSSSDSP